MTEKTELRGRLSGRQKTRLQRLLNMMYRPSEIAEEIGFEVRQVYRVYIPLGLPHERDGRNHIFINGTVFRDWYLEHYKKIDLEENQVYCLTCKQAVKILDPEFHEKDGLYYLTCHCPECGRKTTKILSKE
jgi:Zn finger protein HypA/HybF involved in hydrogenase expression